MGTVCSQRKEKKKVFLTSLREFFRESSAVSLPQIPDLRQQKRNPALHRCRKELSPLGASPAPPVLLTVPMVQKATRSYIFLAVATRDPQLLTPLSNHYEAYRKTLEVLLSKYVKFNSILVRKTKKLNHNQKDVGLCSSISFRSCSPTSDFEDLNQNKSKTI